ncbi:translation initiation factor IF-2-like [Nycticebus coucang]|uniref:translation initiation factor IF-2-like n=1 Tax=Nycticebus coucang TaxID=9470 RepID=UPI00234C2545|nr:translation initiation factor IF-2-like [Nycticebus coucang]
MQSPLPRASWARSPAARRVAAWLPHPADPPGSRADPRPGLGARRRESPPSPPPHRPGRAQERSAGQRSAAGRRDTSRSPGRRGESLGRTRGEGARRRRGSGRAGRGAAACGWPDPWAAGGSRVPPSSRRRPTARLTGPGSVKPSRRPGRRGRALAVSGATSKAKELTKRERRENPVPGNVQNRGTRMPRRLQQDRKGWSGGTCSSEWQVASLGRRQPTTSCCNSES